MNTKVEAQNRWRDAEPQAESDTPVIPIITRSAAILHGGEDREETVREFVHLVHKHTPDAAVIGVSVLHPSSGMKHRYFSAREREDAIKHIMSTGNRANVFLRVMPMRQQPTDGGRGKAEDSLGASVLFADIDAYGDDHEAALQALRSLPYSPTLITCSGRGLQAWWALNRFETDLAAITSRNRRLMQDLNAVIPGGPADSVFDPARIMRVPGTYNLKDGQTRLAYVVERVSKEYALSDFPGASETDNDGTAPHLEGWEPAKLPENFLFGLTKKDPLLAKRIVSEAGAREAGAKLLKDGSGVDRSINDFHIACRLLRLEYTREEALAVLIHPTWYSGSKGRTRRIYAIATITRAQQAIEQGPSKYFTEKSRFVPKRLGEKLFEEQHYIYVAENLWRYEDGAFRPDGEHHMRRLIQDELDESWVVGHANGVGTWIVDRTRIRIEDVNQHHGLVNVRNGMLDTKTRQLLPHDPQYRSLIQLPVNYDPKADTSGVDRFVQEILPPDAIPLFWEYLGSCLITDRYFPKAFLMLVGPPDAGKSKLLEFVFRLLGGSAYVSAISLQDLADNAFMRYELFGKLANIFGDLSEAETQNMGYIKLLTGNDAVQADRKYKQSFSFTNTARLFFSANHYPPVRGADSAYFQRAHIIPCEKRFDVDRADPEIIAKVTTDPCLSGALLRMLDGLACLRGQNGLTHSESVDNARREYRAEIDSVTAFLEEETAADPEGRVTKEEMYSEYRSWCVENGRNALSKYKYSSRIKRELGERMGIGEEYPKINGVQKWCWTGRRLKNRLGR